MKAVLHKYVFILLLVAFAINSSAQKVVKEVSREVFTVAEQMPSFPGGKDALNKYIRKHLRYPAKAMKDAEEGRVILRFIIEPDGQLTHATVIQSMNPECDKAALSIVQKMPKWDPAMQNGVFVAAYYTLPITFAMH